MRNSRIKELETNELTCESIQTSINALSQSHETSADCNTPSALRHCLPLIFPICTKLYFAGIVFLLRYLRPVSSTLPSIPSVRFASRVINFNDR